MCARTQPVDRHTQGFAYWGGRGSCRAILPPDQSTLWLAGRLTLPPVLIRKFRSGGLLDQENARDDVRKLRWRCMSNGPNSVRRRITRAVRFVNDNDDEHIPIRLGDQPLLLHRRYVLRWAAAQSRMIRRGGRRVGWFRAAASALHTASATALRRRRRRFPTKIVADGHG